MSTELPKTIQDSAPLMFTFPNPVLHSLFVLSLSNKMCQSDYKVTASQLDQVIHAGVIAEPTV